MTIVLSIRETRNLGINLASNRCLGKQLFSKTSETNHFREDLS